MSRGIFIGIILGIIAGLIGGALLWLGRFSEQAGLAETSVDTRTLYALTETLSSDDMQGRLIGSAESAKAREVIARAFRRAGLQPFDGGYIQTFSAEPRTGSGLPRPVIGANVVGLLPGDTPGQGPLMVITAHYDHVGVQNGQIYNGADDNAAGVAALIAVAKRIKAAGNQHDIVFAALDGEEFGFLGAADLLHSGDIDRARVALNLNFDMVSRSATNELYAVGTAHTPGLRGFVRELAEAAPVNLRMGHDQPGTNPRDDWTKLSDHAVFHLAGIPFLYFGVDDHEDYHQPTDDFENIDRDFFYRSAETLARAAIKADAELQDIAVMK